MVAASVETEQAAERPDRNRGARDRERPQDPDRRRREGVHLRAQHAVEGHGRTFAGAQVGGSRQLLQEQRVARRLAGDELRARLRVGGAPRAQDVPGERARGVALEVPERQVRARAPRPRTGAPPGPPPRSGSARAEQQQARRVRVAQRLRQQRERVGVRPLQVVDERDDRGPLAERAQEVAEGGEHRGPDLAGVEPGQILRRVRDGADPAEDGEGLQQHRGARRDHALDALGVELAQHQGERVDDPVDGLEGDELALVAARREEHGVPARRSCRGPTGRRGTSARASTCRRRTRPGRWPPARPPPARTSASSASRSRELRLAPDEAGGASRAERQLRPRAPPAPAAPAPRAPGRPTSALSDPARAGRRTAPRDRAARPPRRRRPAAGGRTACGTGSRARGPRTGAGPVSSSNRITPKAYQSAAAGDRGVRDLLGRHVLGRARPRERRLGACSRGPARSRAAPPAPRRSRGRWSA